MKKKNYIFLMALAFIALSCKKDDAPIPPEPQVIDTPEPEPEPDPVNRVPENFSLLTPEIDGIIVDRTPTFSWEQATDPDGDMVTYDLYVDTQENPNTLLAENLGTTSMELQENLDFETQYYWKVVAKDSKGASTEMIQPLTISIPVKHLSRYDQNSRGGGFEIEYVQGKLTSFDDLLAIYDNSSAKLERLMNSKNNVTYEYQYTNEGKQLEINTGDMFMGKTWTFGYDGNNSLISIDQEIRLDPGKGEIKIILNKTAFKYADMADKNPNIIEGNFEDENVIFRYVLKWEGDNIVEVLLEVDLQKGNGFEFIELTKIEYDNNINPYYQILSNQFGFEPMHVLTDYPTGLESFEFPTFKWQSFNNIISYQVFNSPTALDPIGGYGVNYTYSEDYYPISGNRFPMDEGSTFLINWSYLDE